MKTFPNNVEHREAQALAELDADFKRAKWEERKRQRDIWFFRFVDTGIILIILGNLLLVVRHLL